MLKIRKFSNINEYEKYSEKLEAKDRCFPENVIAVIESETHISADVTINCKKKKTALKRFFEAVAEYPDLIAWDGWFNLDNEDDEHLKDERFNYMTGRNDYTGNYSIGLENSDGSFYIYMNVSKEQKELSGLQYDADHNIDKSIEWNKQTYAIKESLIQYYENELSGEWRYQFMKIGEYIRNIKIGFLHRDRIKGEINYSYEYTKNDYKGAENNWYMRVTGKNGKITYFWSSNKFSGMAEHALNEEILNHIIRLIPEFHYLPADEGQETK